MADLGDPIRIIEIVPPELPIPIEIPQFEPVQEPVPEVEEEPVWGAHTWKSGRQPVRFRDAFELRDAILEDLRQMKEGR